MWPRRKRHLAEATARARGQQERAAQALEEAPRNSSGQVVQASGNQIILRSPESQQELALAVTDSTSVQVAGRHASVGQVAAGSDVRASYQLVAGKPTALRSEVTSQ